MPPGNARKPSIFLCFHAEQKMKSFIKDLFGKCDEIRKCGFGHIYRRNFQ